MPYIKQEGRPHLDGPVDVLLERLECASAGDYNYVISRLISEGLKEMSYSEINSMVGMMECAKLEFYARLARPYEDKKIAENGDLIAYKEAGNV